MIRRSTCVLLALLVNGSFACSQLSSDSAGKRSTQERTPANVSVKSTEMVAPSGGSGSSEQGSTVAACTPRCGATCGTDDGCGAKCSCGKGEECVEQICVNPSCGPCRPNERCNAGKCECIPDCQGRACQPDGCGATCECPAGTVVNANAQVVAPSDCKDSCASAGWTCGVLCGVECGKCSGNETCNGGACKCSPHCDGTSCSDGCGGTCACATGTVCNLENACVAPSACVDTCASAGATCGTVCGVQCGTCDSTQACIDGLCREALSCGACALQLRVLERTVLSGKIARVVLAVDFAGEATSHGPRLIDLRIAADRVVALVAAEAGPALLETGKTLFKDETTSNTWQRKADHSYQVLAYTLTGTVRVKPGRVMTLTFDLAEPGPVRFALQRHAQTFAPLDADTALQATQYDQALVVSQ